MLRARDLTLRDIAPAKHSASHDLELHEQAFGPRKLRYNKKINEKIRP